MWEHDRHHACLVLNFWCSPEYFKQCRFYKLLIRSRNWSTYIILGSMSSSDRISPLIQSLAMGLYLQDCNLNTCQRKQKFSFHQTKLSYKISAATNYFHHSLIMHTKAHHFFWRNSNDLNSLAISISLRKSAPSGKNHNSEDTRLEVWSSRHYKLYHVKLSRTTPSKEFL